MTVTRADRVKAIAMTLAANLLRAGWAVRRWWEGGWYRQILIGALVVSLVELTLLYRVLEAITTRWSQPL